MIPAIAALLLIQFSLMAYYAGPLWGFAVVFATLLGSVIGIGIARLLT